MGLLVGIGAGIPSFKNDIRLGDVAVAIPTQDNSGVIGYDLLKIEPEEIRIKQWQNASHSGLRNAISYIRTRSTANICGQNSFISHLGKFEKTSFERPRIPSGTPFSRIERQPPNNPIVHYGCIMSGNRVIKSAKVRDDMSQNYNAIAIEMEAAGIMNRLPVAVIRGISDFADAEKTDDWQFYAAAAAAAYAKELLMHLDPLYTVRSKYTCLLACHVYSDFTGTPQISPRPARMSQANLNILLDERRAKLRSNLDWRNSVVDLLKVLNLDSSEEARARLARRWNILVGEDSSAIRNIAIHGVIMDELSKNLGNTPDSIARALSVDN